MQSLVDGYRRFRADRWPKQQALYKALSQGQKPQVLVIACCDSRVDPATIFDAAPGELFIIRNVANIVPPYEQGEGLHGTSAAIEFAVDKLNVGTILVMGHGQCGGVSAALQNSVEGSAFLGPWIALLDEAKGRCAHEQDPQAALERENIRVSLERLRQFPFIADRVARGALRLEGALFAVADGRLEVLDPANGAFMRLD